MSPVARSDLTPGCSICSWDPVSIHSKSGTSHWKGVKRIITYLGNMKNLWLTFGGCRNTILDGFCDADWAGQPHTVGIQFPDTRSTWAWEPSLGALRNSTLSSTEAEHITQTHAAKEAMYLCTFVQEICGLDKPIAINCDNQGAIMLSKDNKFHAWTKHIDIQYHFI